MDREVLVAGSSRLSDIAWLVRSLDRLTFAGQRHDIAKIMGLLETEMSRCWRRPDATLERLLARLRREADRPLPNVPAFTASAEALIGMVRGRSSGHTPTVWHDCARGTQP